MRKLLATIMMLVIAGSLAFAEGENLWMTDWDAAMKLSRESGKPILANFTGSDWCGWCIKLDEEVFSTDVFKKFAAEELILVCIDFPRQTRQSSALRKRNNDLMRKYKVQGFPTILLLNHRGRVIATTGYQQGGAEKYVEHLKQLLDKAKK